MATQYQGIGTDYAINPAEMELAKAYYSKPTVGNIDSGLTPEQYYSSLNPESQKKSISDYIRLAMEQGGEDIKRQYSPQYEQLASEQATTGSRYRSPASMASTGRLRQQQGQSITDLIRSLMGKEAELNYGAESKRPEQMLAGAQMFGNQQLQGQELGLRERTGLSGLLNEAQARAQQESQFTRNQNFNENWNRANQAWDREKTAAGGRQNLENRTSFGEGLAGNAIAGLAGGVGGALTGYGLSKLKSK